MVLYWSHYHRSFMLVTMNSWIVTVYPFASWKLICSTYHSFPFFFRLPWTWIFMSNPVGVSRKAEDAYPIDALGPCSKILVEFELFIYFCNFECTLYHFGHFMFFVVYDCFTYIVFLPFTITLFWFPLESWFSWLLFVYFRIVIYSNALIL